MLAGGEYQRRGGAMKKTILMVLALVLIFSVLAFALE